MKQTLIIIQLVLFIVMATSLFFLATRLDFTSSNDKEPIYWIFFFVVLIYVLVVLFLMWKSYKTQNVRYTNASIFLGLLYLVFLLFLYS